MRHGEHRWKETTPEGDKREILVQRFGGRWSVQSRLRGAERWTRHDPPHTADLETLLDILRRKYARRRVPYDDLVSIEKWLARRAGGDPL